MPLAIEHFPENPSERQHCFVWSRAKDGKRIVFGCDTDEGCKSSLPEFERRAEAADVAKAETM